MIGDLEFADVVEKRAVFNLNQFGSSKAHLRRNSSSPCSNATRMTAGLLVSKIQGHCQRLQGDVVHILQLPKDVLELSECSIQCRCTLDNQTFQVYPVGLNFEDQ